MSLMAILVKALDALDLDDDVNRFVIDRAVKVTRSRPHPWTTKHDYISWTGLTDRTYNARLLPAKPYPKVEQVNTRRPPLADIAALFARPAGTQQRLCEKSTGLFPAFAQYLTDGFIRTQLHNDPALTDRKRTTSNHEIDMSPLYGRTPTQTMALRMMTEVAGSRGKLKSQTINGEEHSPFLFAADGTIAEGFADAKGGPLLDMPLGLKNASASGRATLLAVGGDRVNAAPQTAMVNTLWLREHNRLAGMLEAKHPDWDDERVFETARNIIIVMFIKVVVEEYINHINSTEFPLKADPQAAWGAKWNRPNWMTVEFGLLYRWHGLVKEHVQWGGVERAGRTMLLDNTLLLGGGLADAFVQVSANRTSELGLENGASFLEEAEKHAIDQSRQNHVAGYNDYRIAMGMEPARNFASIVGGSDDSARAARLAALASRLQALYGDVDNVEFYVGLFAERVEKNGPLPELVSAMVAMDAFSQALTNPLLSEHVWGNPNNRRLAFTDEGLAAIEATGTLRDVLGRNSTGLGRGFVGMTRREWRRV
jgi:prostaglandin-endoperoxide synthase 2